MIDVHCHILPAVDDGANSLDESLAMAEIAEKDGIADIFATPHYNPELYAVPAEMVDEGVKSLQEAIRFKGLRLTLHTGHDAHLTPELLPRLQRGEVKTLANSRYFLLEPPEFFDPEEISRFIFRAQGEGFVPILTHPERIGFFHRYPQWIGKYVEQGTWIQITAGSLTGYFGSHVQHWALGMVKENLVHIIATDAHSPRHRRPVLSEALHILEEIHREGNIFVEDYPRLILEDQPPDTLQGDPIIDLFS